MELKRPHRSSPLAGKLRQFINLPGIMTWALLIIAGFVCLTVLLLASARYGMDLYKFGDARNMSEMIKHFRETRLRVIPNYMQGLTAQPPFLKIDVKFQDLQKLVYDRAKALEYQVILADSLSIVNASITYGEEILPAKLRLKGDWTSDNLQGDKWSFRLKLRGDNTLFGMKQFSLQHPRVRNYIYEWLFHKMLEKEEIIPLRYIFVHLSLNGKDLGIYALEEHFEKRLIEYNRNREGLILKFDENPRWMAVRNVWPQASQLGLSSMFSASVDVFKSKTVMQDSVLYRQFLLASSLLERFRTGDLKAAEVFDIKKMAAYFAIVDLMGAQHALSWHNLRFYYNPINSRLEPIGFDGDAGATTACLNGLMKSNGFATNPFQDLVLGDQTIFREYVACLEKLANPDYLADFLAENKEELTENLGIIYSEYPNFSYSANTLYSNQKTIQQSLDPVKGLHAYIDRISNSTLTLLIGNTQAWPIEVNSLSCPDGRTIVPEKDVILESHNPSSPISFSRINFQLPEEILINDSLTTQLALQYSVLGSSVAKTTGVFSWPLVENDIIQNDLMRQAPNISAFDFLSLSQSAKTITIKPGNWRISNDVIIPPGYRVLCTGGTTLSLERKAKILSYSPLFFAGDKNAKIVVRSNDSTGQGLIVLETSERSLLEHVIFENLMSPVHGGWSLTGALTFFKADVSFDACVFRANRSEDFVNIVRSDFSMMDCLLTGISSDAIDGDFCTGQMTNVAVVDVGNDAFDVSGSNVVITGLSVTRAGDKGISVGENSLVKASDVEINNSEIGLAVKDLSRLELAGIELTDTRVGFVLFQKKPEFGNAVANVERLTSENIEVLYLIEKGSELTLNSQRIDGDQDDIEAMLYGIIYGKSSRKTSNVSPQ